MTPKKIEIVKVIEGRGYRCLRCLHEWIPRGVRPVGRPPKER